jgi:hypothetical protein
VLRADLRLVRYSLLPAQENAAKSCLLGAENDTMTFPEIVRTLIQAGFESYAIDYRRCRAIYYLSRWTKRGIPHPPVRRGCREVRHERYSGSYPRRSTIGAGLHLQGIFVRR